MDELLDFWNPGVYYSQTALRPQGCLVRAALVPLVADLLAARQLSGLGPHNHARVLCSVCTTPADGVENTDPATFEPRDLEKHRADAKAWLDARTTFEREKLFQSTGVRYSELLRLPYWNPFLYTVVDTMHNLYLGILQRHIRVIWGISVDVEDGDASGNMIGVAPERPSEAKMAAGVDLLLTATTLKLRTAGKAVLYHLCLDRGIRRAGTVSQLVKNLTAWVHLQSELTPDYGEDDSADIRSAEKTLQGLKASTALARRRQDLLQTMCKVRGIEFEDSTKKEVLAERLHHWRQAEREAVSATRATPPVSADSRGLGQASPPPSSADQDDPTVRRHRHDQEAIGRDTLSAYMEDRCRMQLPSWMNAPPVAFGTKQHGKLSADQWRALCIVNLPVTLIRTWSFQEERRVKMLENFLDVVEAVETFGLLEIGENQIATAEVLMRRYLEGVKDLYKGMKIQPNHHLALHIGIFLRLFGPVHSWRAFVFERFNFYLQSINTNMTFGELEMTFMMHSCRAANFQPFLRSPIVQKYMQDFSQQLQAADKKDRRGMRLDAVLRSAGEHEAASMPLQGEPFKASRPVPLGDPEYKALLQRLSYDDGNMYVDEEEFYAGRPAGRLPLSRHATSCSSLLVSGVSYKPWSRSSGDSNAMFRHPALGRNSHPGRIEQIFLHTRGAASGEDNVETFLVVKRLQPLNRLDAGLDPYRRYPAVGGRLYYSEYDDALFVIRGEDLVSHFASTSMEHLVVRAPGAKDPTKTHPCLLSKRCIHVRPLDRVSVDCISSQSNRR
ncbi:uncharacterized protein TRAVEDRAFT_127575 [Trametes versicolor FP-101664 SS1]|uniref:uncharacterized protein n=1 Tax=Trametes versicolor (strain FP-101664) TaxID=717944 RepID=UPI00046221AF|nr:uncharacterized protein TRAVEDRAFT_127575 [Trametes versicolor FP-101664 SS1]EIW56596.1 hypothetical protein TRAVEDRAFT_127575 [Trametes versicolor FP-101664 SS1]